jgi:hypothetical protein
MSSIRIEARRLSPDDGSQLLAAGVGQLACFIDHKKAGDLVEDVCLIPLAWGLG